MHLFSFLLSWYNIPFVVALGCCLIFALLQVAGSFGEHDADADADADVDVDADADVDVDADADVDAGADVHAPHHVDAGGSAFMGALSALGVGRVPLLLVMMSFLGSFGAIGLLANTLLANLLGSYPPAALIPILLFGGLLALPITGRISRLLARLASHSSTAISIEQLVGRAGVVVSPSISRSYGRVQVRDRFGTLHTVYAVIESDEPLGERSEVALLTYDVVRRHFIVRALDRPRAR